MQEVPNLYVHCKTGIRARLAASILAQKGIPVTLIVDSKYPFIFRSIRVPKLWPENGPSLMIMIMNLLLFSIWAIIIGQ